QTHRREAAESEHGANSDHATDAGDERSAHRRRDCRYSDDMPPPAPSELIAVSPRRHFRPLRRADPDESQSLAQLREPNVLRRHPQLRLGEQALALLDRFPPLLERREVPPLARLAHDPQA